MLLAAKQHRGTAVEGCASGTSPLGGAISSERAVHLLCISRISQALSLAVPGASTGLCPTERNQTFAADTVFTGKQKLGSFMFVFFPLQISVGLEERKHVLLCVGVIALGFCYSAR